MNADEKGLPVFRGVFCYVIGKSFRISYSMTRFREDAHYIQVEDRMLTQLCFGARICEAHSIL